MNIKYVDLNGLSIFAEELKKWLHNHVIESEGFGKLEEQIKSAVERIIELEEAKIYKIVEELPEKGLENTIYLLVDSGVSEGSLLEYIYIGDRWEELGSFSPELSLSEYLKIEDFPFEKGSSENSAVLKGEYQGYKNIAISQTSMAVGAATTAGLKGWYYSAIDFTNKKITLSDKPTYILVGSTLINGGWSSDTPNIKVNDVISLVNNSKYDFCSKVTAVNGNVITVDSLPFTKLVKDNGASVAVIAGQFSDGYSLYIPERQDAGIIDFGGGAFSEGGQSKASNICAHAEGLQTHAYGQYSHAEGRETKAGYAAHAEGKETTASGENSHAEGKLTKATGANSHAEGGETEAGGMRSHAEGANTIASGNTAHAEGVRSIASGPTSHAEGYKTESAGDSSHTEGAYTYALKNTAHAEGMGRLKDDGTIDKTIGALDIASHVEGETTTASGKAAHAEGSSTKATNYGSHAEGRLSESTGDSAHAEGYDTEATKAAAHSEGWGTHANGIASHAEGRNTKATNINTHVEGYYSIASGDTAHAEGCRGLALGGFSHVEGYGATIPDNITGLSNDEIETLWDASKNFNIVKGSTSHSEGVNNLVLGNYSHGEGGSVKVNSDYSHAEGRYTTASGTASHAEGKYTKTTNDAEHAEGIYNKSNTGDADSDKTIHSVGIGESDTKRKNAHEITLDGKHYIIGIGGYDGTNPDGSEDVATVITRVSATPNWNASEGEAGYIENRTHYINYHSKVIINTQDIGIDSPTIIDFTCLDGILHYASDGSFAFSKQLNMQYVDDENVEYTALGGLVIPLNAALNKNKLYLQNPRGIPISTDCSFWSQSIVPLNEQFIPDTIARKTDILTDVVRTSAQTLSDDAKNQVKENLEITNPDWNAQEGKSGYIENRTHYVNLDNGIRITLDNADITLSSDENWYEKIIIPLGIWGEISLYYYDSYNELKHYVLTEGQTVSDVHFGCNFTAVLNEIGSCDLLLTDFTDPKAYVDNGFANTRLVYEDGDYVIQKLDSMYLPDTVIKTSAQTLSDTAKKQVKENLGLSTVPTINEHDLKVIVFDEDANSQTLSNAGITQEVIKGMLDGNITRIKANNNGKSKLFVVYVMGEYTYDRYTISMLYYDTVNYGTDCGSVVNVHYGYTLDYADGLYQFYISE